MDVNIVETNHLDVENYINGHSSKGANLWGAQKDGEFYIFRLYAPNADRVFIKGDFTNWQRHELSKNPDYGYFFTRIKASVGDYYKYVISKDGREVEKTDPYAKAMDKEGDFASLLVDLEYDFNDHDFIAKRDKNFNKPMNIYEIHVGSWIRHSDKVGFLDIVDSLIAYLKEMHYTHVEIMPITEYPYYPSWGYQSTGFFAVTSRFGHVKDLKKFVDLLHQNGIGVILDMVAVHFASDSFGLDHFDGTSLYESKYEDLKYSEWGSNNFDYSKGHVRSFMKSAISYWIEEFHFDGVRIDAVSYMIHYNGNKNRGLHEDNIYFIKDLNKTLDEFFPSIMKIAEDSSDYPNVTGDNKDALGFDYKWDLGWMNDTITYFKVDSINRVGYQEKINFSMFYYYDEKFILPLSHDEVVHLKKPMIDKMSGEYEDKFKQLKLLNVYQMTHPGKKLNFMGNEIATFDEWNENGSINFDILKFPTHDNFHNFVKDLNKFYLETEALYERDFSEDGFRWRVVDDNINSVFAYERISEDSRYLIILNMTNTYKGSYQIEYNEEVRFKEVFNSLSSDYGSFRETNRDISIKKGENLVLELWEYEALILKVTDNEKQ